jgi:hypothetical protein
LPHESFDGSRRAKKIKTMTAPPCTSLSSCRIDGGAFWLDFAIESPGVASAADFAIRLSPFGFSGGAGSSFQIQIEFLLGQNGRRPAAEERAVPSSKTKWKPVSKFSLNQDKALN